MSISIDSNLVDLLSELFLDHITYNFDFVELILVVESNSLMIARLGLGRRLMDFLGRGIRLGGLGRPGQKYCHVRGRGQLSSATSSNHDV